MHRILSEVLDGGASSSLLLDRLHTRGERDRSLATELVFGVLRRLAALDHHIEAVAGRPLGKIDPPLRQVLRLGLYQLRYLEGVPDHAAVDQAVRLAREVAGRAQAGFVNAVLRGYLRGRGAATEPKAEDDLLAYLSVTQCCPRWLAERWLLRYGADETRRLVEAQNLPPRTTLRVNTARIGVDELRERLVSEGYRVEPSVFLPAALVVRPGSVARSAVLREGLAWVQDEAAQLVVQLVDARPGERVYDACAAPGGKTQVLALAVGAEGLVVAGDRRPGRLRMLAGNLRRLELEAVALLASDAGAPGLRPGFDRVLVDAPCSGTGTLRRNPEIRWRLDPSRLLELQREQVAMLKASAELLRPGGRLVYATCSVEPEENLQVVEAALTELADFHKLDAGSCLTDSSGLPTSDDGGLHTWPSEPELDGFTAYVLERDG